MTLSVLLATTNPAKAAWLRMLTDGLDLALTNGPDVGSPPAVDEDASSHLGNAIRKAVAWSRERPGVALASDGGLAIPALGDDWSSLVTRRGTGGDVSDEEHAARLLRRMRDLHGDQRAAHRVEAVALAREGALLGAWEASGQHGRIAEDYVPPPGGTDGFWIPGLWVSNASGKREWELSEADLATEDEPWLALKPLLRDLLGRLAIND